MPSTTIDYSFSNTAPTGITPSLAAALTGASPGAITAVEELTAVEPVVIDPAFAEGTGDGADLITPGLAAPGTASAAQPIEPAPIVPDPSDENMHTATLYFNGKLTLAQVFGLYVAPAAVVIKSVQLAAQTAPQGASAIIELVDADGISLGRTATLPAGEKIAHVVFDPPLALSAATIVQAKVTAVGSTTNGGYLQATLVAQVIP